ncbi:DUF4167 domain-containing protein [Sphingomonas aliaeris]|uniref:DUF4167 domain-containing protein n=1 Tax=Sphingomonas aliaeris TaxID=2759526 RepID=A0A974S3R4_9SPHN|nr:DUF4167 domain-containing protein [Sphingomonas aliaeris]QQV76828.1 DUF4167 domain-containing protein [Sphingomonas aliaeris]
MINNRQAGRRRGRGGQQQRPQGNSGARDNGNRIDNRSRGNAAQLLEKYKALARDAQMSGDRVNTEYYLQFADHYFRVLAETRSRFEENRAPAQGGANTFQDDETEYDDDGAPIVAEQVRQQNGNQNYQGDRPQNNGNQQDRAERQDRQDRPERQDRQANDRGDQGNRADRGQQDDDRPRRSNSNANGGNVGSGASYGNEGERYVREDRGNRNDNRGYEGRAEPRAERGEPRGNRAERNDRNDRYQSEDRAPVQPDRAPIQQDAAPQPVVAEEQPQEAPRRRGRPRREPVAEAPHTFDTAILPPSLNISAVTAPPPVLNEAAPANDVALDEPEEKPRRRRGRPPASEVTNAS